jgi:hypothetical protein
MMPLHAGVIEKELLRSSNRSFRGLPMAAVFDQNYVKRLSGSNVKRGRTRWARRATHGDIAEFKRRNRCSPGDGLVCLDGDIYQATTGSPDADALSWRCETTRRSRRR